MPSGTTPNLGLTLPTIAGDSSIWGTELNNDLIIIDGMIGPFAGDFRFLPFEGVNGRQSVLFPNAPNGLVVMSFILDRYFNVNNFGLVVTTPDVGKFAYAGIYSITGNLISYGKFPLDANGNFVLPAINAVKLSPGIYYVAVGADSIIAQGGGYQSSSPQFNALPGGVAANQISGGAMPATLGVITGPLTLTTPTPLMLS